MPPPIAALLTFIFIFTLFYREKQRNGGVDGALWLPILWLTITSSRFISQWIDIATGGLGRNEEGSVVDVLYFLGLILIGIRTLDRRGVTFSQIAHSNILLTALFIYSLMSVFWSEFPFIAFKRWIKTLGHPIMALIIITELCPENALRAVMKRCSFILLPLSVLFIKYYPQYGRGFSIWTGEAYNQGVTTQKNSLGLMCMMFFVFFFWNIVSQISTAGLRNKAEEMVTSLIFLIMSGWLLKMANSSTSLSTMLIAVATITMLGFHIVNKRFIGTYLIGGLIIAAAAEYVFDLYATILDMLGEDPTLTDRTIIWADCLALVDNPIFGVGFESFWLGQRLDILWQKWPWKPNQVHNGYIEIYLSLGIIGVGLMLMVLVSTFKKISADLLVNFEFAKLRLGYFFAIVSFNYAEAAFKNIHPLWTIFYIVAMGYPTIRPKKATTNMPGNEDKTLDEPSILGKKLPTRPTFRKKRVSSNIG